MPLHSTQIYLNLMASALMNSSMERYFPRIATKAAGFQVPPRSTAANQSGLGPLATACFTTLLRIRRISGRSYKMTASLRPSNGTDRGVLQSSPDMLTWADYQCEESLERALESCYAIDVLPD